MESWLANALSWVINILPRSPLQDFIENSDFSNISPYLGFLNWFVPVGSILGLLDIWLTGIVAFYIFQVTRSWWRGITGMTGQFSITSGGSGS